MVFCASNLECATVPPFLSRSKPPSAADSFVYDNVPQTFRAQVFHILDDATGKYVADHDRWGGESVRLPDQLWLIIRKVLLRELGRFQLSKEYTATSKEDCWHFFINEASHANALNFIDISFRAVDILVRKESPYNLAELGITIAPDDAILELNARFDQHNLGYQFTDGELMRRDSQFTHSEMTVPAFQLLNTPGFEGPHEEFLRAHKAYLKPDEKEAIRECGNAFESTLKSICTLRQWPFDAQKDTARKLLAIVFERGLIPDYLQSEFTGLRSMLESGVPTVRNREGAHGQGSVPVQVPRHLAAYVLHMTAAAILLLVTAHKELP